MKRNSRKSILLTWLTTQCRYVEAGHGRPRGLRRLTEREYTEWTHADAIRFATLPVIRAADVRQFRAALEKHPG